MSDSKVEGGLDEPQELEPEQGSLALATEHDRHDRAEWEAAAAGVLRKARRMSDDDADDLVWDKLARTTLDGLSITPLGTPDLLEGLQTAGRPTRDGDWDVRTQPDTNAEALLDLDNGATSLWLRVDADTDFGSLLDGVLLDLAPVVLDGDAGAARAFLAYADGRELELHPATNLGGLDPEVAGLAKENEILGGVVDATVVHDRGASDVQELGWSMARAADFLRAAEQAGLAPADAAALVEFRYAVTDDQFATIAKLRAARRLWARVLELCEVEPVTMRIHAVTSRPMLSKYDPWVNMLRTTVAAFAAGVGGADAVTVVPFDSPLGKPDAFGRRIARNTSSLLIAESHVARVTDPAGGAYAVEKLTDDLAAAAWAELGRIESDGDEAFDARVAEVVARRDDEVAHRRRPLTGLSEFPNLAESLPERVAVEDDVRRYGAAFEALRDDPAARPVQLATIGPIAQHTARATFATNLLAAGGIAVTDEPGPVALVAGTDAAYEESGAELAETLRQGGATRIIVAGKPRDWADDSCALGDDAIAFLTRTREALA